MRLGLWWTRSDDIMIWKKQRLQPLQRLRWWEIVLGKDVFVVRGGFERESRSEVCCELVIRDENRKRYCGEGFRFSPSEDVDTFFWKKRFR